MVPEYTQIKPFLSPTYVGIWLPELSLTEEQHILRKSGVIVIHSVQLHTSSDTRDRLGMMQDARMLTEVGIIDVFIKSTNFCPEQLLRLPLCIFMC